MTELAGTPALGADNGHDRALFGPEQLNAQEASRLLSRGPGRLVVWMGERGAGKTTICAELYERQRHAGSGVRFAGSWTLLAFEALAHHRRATGSPLPGARDTLDSEGREILHLALSTGEAPLHLLLADLPGEVFRKLADCQLATTEVPWLQRADKLVLVVDGERVCDTAVRSSTLTRVRQLLERLQSSELPGPDTRLALLVTKWDLVQANPGALAYWERREPELLADLRALDPQAVALRSSAIRNGREDGLAAVRTWLLELAPAPLVSPPADSWDALPGEPSLAPWPEGEFRSPPAVDASGWPPPARRRWLPWRRRR